MTRALPDEDERSHARRRRAASSELAERAGAVVLGPGLGRSEGAQEFAREVARRVEKPLLIDADGLNAHAGRLDLLAGRPGPTVLTPHAGELGAAARDRTPTRSPRIAWPARATAAEQSGCVVVLKGDDSIVAAPGGPVAISPGAIAGARHGRHRRRAVRHRGRLPGQGPGRLRGRGGRRARPRAGRQVAAARHGADHTVAGDVIEALPEALRSAR